MKPFRFGIQSTGPADADGWAALARRVESLGYDTLTCADHFDGQFAPLPALVAAAEATTTLRLGTMVLANDFRHPVVTAKEVATADVLSGGRFEFGIGAGWMTTDYEQAGIAMDRPGVRIARLAEAIQVIRPLVAGETVDHDGEHYRITGLVGFPAAVQQPGVPLVVGGGGRRILELAGRVADIVGINVDLRAGVIDERAGPTGTPEATDEKIAWVRAAAGDRFDEIELQVRVHVAAPTDDPEGMAEVMAPALGIDPADALASPHALVGTVPGMIETLQARRERWGISYIGLSVDAMESMAPVIEALTGT
jgi:probable F420-dependent oxidoreductase